MAMQRSFLLAAAVGSAGALNAHALLKPVSVLRATNGERVSLTEQWNADERAVMVLMRSFG
tara:strand:- start:1336 stop:1518 length:183 start_codon:yes stop_codon:yes gene_type:complete